MSNGWTNSIYGEVGYIENIGHTTQRKDNTAQERRKALRVLMGQYLDQANQDWHPPLLTEHQVMEQTMDMLGIDPKWLRGEDEDGVNPWNDRALPRSLFYRTMPNG